MTVTPHFDIPFRLTGGPSQRIAYRDLIVSDSPSSYWRMESANSGLDEMGRRPLTFTGSPVSVPGLIRDGGQARDFSSTAYGDIPIVTSPTHFGGYSMEAWGMVHAPIPDYAMMFVGLGVTSYICLASYGAACSVYNTTIGQVAGSIGPAPVPNQIYHIVGVWDTQNLIIYMNGNSYSFPAVLPSINLGTAYRVANYGSGTYPMKGIIDEIAIYDYALTPQQVQTHYLAGTAGMLVAGAATNEQDSFEDIADCVEAIIRTPLGFRSDNLTFGFPNIELATQPILNATIAELVSEQETRAQIIMDEKPDAFDPLIDRIRVEVS